jgi:hypothetical protein
VSTAGDAIARYQAIEAPLDRGLAGGTVSASHGGELLTLKRDQLIEGVAVSGSVKLARDPIPADGDSVLATLTAKAGGMRAASLTATWTTSGADAVAQVLGTVGPEVLAGSLPAP